MDRKRYRCLDLGRAHGDTLLMELLPYTSPGKKLWLYERFGHYATRTAYEAAMMPSRQQLIRAVLAEAPRELVICYEKAD